MPAVKASVIERDWLSKSLAGIVLGFLLALTSSGLFMQLVPVAFQSAKVQLAMWLVVPIWLGVLSGCYLFCNGKRAWLWLGSVNVLLFLLYSLIRLI